MGKTLGVCHFSKNKKKFMFPCCNAQTIISPGYIKKLIFLWCMHDST